MNAPSSIWILYAAIYSSKQICVGASIPMNIHLSKFVKATLALPRYLSADSCFIKGAKPFLCYLYQKRSEHPRKGIML